MDGLMVVEGEDLSGDYNPHGREQDATVGSVFVYLCAHDTVYKLVRVVDVQELSQLEEKVKAAYGRL